MNLETYNLSRYLYLIYPAGSGGNHLANMLSFHRDFCERFESNNYQAEVIRLYHSKLKYTPGTEQFGVHFSEMENLDIETLEKAKPRILSQSKKYIFCSHYREYYLSKLVTKSLSEFEPSFQIIFTYPKHNKVADLRITTGLWSLAADNPKEFYDIDFLKNQQDVPFDLSKTISFDTDLYFSSQGFDYIQNFLNENFSTTLPEICGTLHKLYIDYQSAYYGLDI